MFGSDILDVAIGLLLMFLMLSLICSALNELLEAVLKYRARDLERGLREMLSDQDLVRRLYNHSLINGLFRGSYDPNDKRKLPTYIPSRTFTLALMDMLQPATATSLSGAAGTAAAEAAANPLQEFRQSVAALPEGGIRSALLPLIDAAGADAVRARQNIEDWYNAAMDRVSGWYKRRTHAIIACIGLALAITVNGDTVSFTRYLSTNKTARSLIVTEAQAALQKPKNATGGIAAPAPQDLVNSLAWLDREGGLPLGWRMKPVAKTPPDDALYQAQLDDYKRDWRRFPQSFSEWLLKMLGFALTAAAVSLGAPFWFDVLNKFMVVRSTVKPAEKSTAEQSKS